MTGTFEENAPGAAAGDAAGEPGLGEAVVGSAGILPGASARYATSVSRLPGRRARRAAVTPDGKTAYVDNADSNTVTPINNATGKPGKPIKVVGPADIAITPDGKTAWVIAQQDNAIISISTATQKASKPIAVGSGPVAIALKSCPAPPA